MNRTAEPMFRQYRDLLYWKLTSRKNTPPPLHKQRLVRSYARRFGLDVLVETGTFHGDMLAACRNDFRKLFSIEVNKHLYLQARKRFAGYPKITIVPGDSAVVLPVVLKAVDGPSLFWLDAHAMRGMPDPDRPITPIIDELNQVLDSAVDKYVILIDDIRLFSVASAYPSLGEVEDLVRSRFPGWIFEVKNDVARIHADSKR